MLYSISNEITPIEKIIGRINLIRVQNNLNQEQLAVRLGISQPAVSKYMKDRIPPAAILLKLARLGGTTIEWLLTGKKEHFIIDNNLVKEGSVDYSGDVDIQLAKKISSLETEAKETLTNLIDLLKK